MRPFLLALALTVAACQRPDAKPPAAPAADADKAKTDAPAAPSATPSSPEVYTLPGVEAERPRTSAPPDAGPSRQDPDTWADDKGKTDASDDTSDDAPAPLPDGLERTVAQYLARTDDNDLGPLLALYADRVRYYDRGTLPRADVRTDKERYVRRWPVRTFTQTAAPQIEVGEEALSATVRLEYAFDVSDPASGRTRSGQAWTDLVLEPTPRRDGWRIVAERGGVR